jgi:F-box interacting protein
LAAAATRYLPEEILAWEIMVRLPAKDIVRCRAVCRSWRGLTSSPDFLLAHHRAQPSLPLFTLYDKAPPTFKRGRALLRFEDKETFKLLASCSGLLLLSLSQGRFICNPVTHQCTLLPRLATTGRVKILALYLHLPSGDYRILYRKEEKHLDLKVAYYILAVSRGSSSRCIGVPLDTKKLTLPWHEMTCTSMVPPVMLRCCLHWNSRHLCNDADIVIFDTVVESFRSMCGPPDANKLCARLCNMQDSMGFSCFDNGRTVIKIWVLEDYEREVWSFKYHIKFPVESLYSLEDTKHLVLSNKGDVLVYNCYQGYMFHCDSGGKLLEEFWLDQYILRIIGHRFKESLVNHDFLHRQAGKLPFFKRSKVRRHT